MRHVWNDVRHGRNVDLYILVLLTVAVIAIDLLGFDVTEQMGSIALAALALIGVSILRMHSSLDALSSLGPPGPRFLDDYPVEVLRDMESAERVRLVGVALSGTLRRQRRLLEAKLDAGHSLEMLIVDPNSAGMRACAERYDSRVTGDQYIQGVPTAATLEILRELRERGSVSLRMTTSALTYGAYELHRIGGSVVIYVEHYAYKGGVDAIPKMAIDERDGKWLQFFQNEIEELWTHAREVDLDERLTR